MASAAATVVAATTAMDLRCDTCVLLLLDEVPARHPRVLMREDVTVVEPPAGVVLDEPDRRGLVGTDGRGVDERSGAVLPAVAVDVEVVEVVVHPEHVQGDLLADLRADDRGVARVGAAVDALERAL